MSADAPVNGQKEGTLGSGQELQVLSQAINALARFGNMGERLAKLEEWKEIVQRPTGYLTGLESRVKSLEEWKSDQASATAGRDERIRDWRRDLTILVIGFVLALFSSWLTSKWGAAPPDIPTSPG